MSAEESLRASASKSCGPSTRQYFAAWAVIVLALEDFATASGIGVFSPAYSPRRTLYAGITIPLAPIFSASP
jgi:hypothetical protein